MAPSEFTSTSTDARHRPEPDGDLRHSPLERAHGDLGAKLVPFGGWLMPLTYGTGTLAEHMACRTGAVAFDVSHLGTVRVQGPGAHERLQQQLSNDLRKVAPGRAQYTHLLDEVDGSVVDDIIVWWLDAEEFDVMPNASNTARVRAAVGGDDTTGDRAVIAVQGPRARRLLSSVAPDAAAVPHFAVTSFSWHGVRCVVAGTGYTGEDGVECAVPADAAPEFWQAVLDTGVVPAGLGARDTLRLEAGFPLHGHELGPGITPLQAGLGWVVGWAKDDFRGRGAARSRARPPACAGGCAGSSPTDDSPRATVPPSWPVPCRSARSRVATFLPSWGGGSPSPCSTPGPMRVPTPSSPSTCADGCFRRAVSPLPFVAATEPEPVAERPS